MGKRGKNFFKVHFFSILSNYYHGIYKASNYVLTIGIFDMIWSFHILENLYKVRRHFFAKKLRIKEEILTQRPRNQMIIQLFWMEKNLTNFLSLKNKFSNFSLLEKNP